MIKMTITIDLPVKDLKELWFTSAKELERWFIEYLFYKKKIKSLEKLILEIEEQKEKDLEKLPSDEEILNVLK